MCGRSTRAAVRRRGGPVRTHVHERPDRDAATNRRTHPPRRHRRLPRAGWKSDDGAGDESASSCTPARPLRPDFRALRCAAGTRCGTVPADAGCGPRSRPQATRRDRGSHGQWRGRVPSLGAICAKPAAEDSRVRAGHREGYARHSRPVARRVGSGSRFYSFVVAYDRPVGSQARHGRAAPAGAIGMNPGGSFQASGPVFVGDAQIAGPWYRQISPEQWRAFWAVFLGWVVDAFDFNMLAFILIDIQKSFTVGGALAGALASVTLIMRLSGAAVAGSLADKYGRKLPLMLSVLWFSLFAFLSGFST